MTITVDNFASVLNNLTTAVNEANETSDQNRDNILVISSILQSTALLLQSPTNVSSPILEEIVRISFWV